MNPGERREARESSRNIKCDATGTADLHLGRSGTAAAGVGDRGTATIRGDRCRVNRAVLFSHYTFD